MRSGLRGNIQGAASAKPITSTTSTKPSSAARLRAKRRAKSRNRVSIALPRPDARIEPQIEDVNRRIADRHQHRTQHEDAEHHREISAHPAVDKTVADAG